MQNPNLERSTLDHLWIALQNAQMSEYPEVLGLVANLAHAADVLEMVVESPDEECWLMANSD